METRDPRAELIKQWAMENPGLMAQAGLAGFDRPSTHGDHHLDAFSNLKKYENDIVSYSKNREHEIKKRRNFGAKHLNNEEEIYLRIFAKKFGLNAGNALHIRNKKQNQYIHGGGWTLESLGKELVNAQKHYEAVVNDVKKKTIHLPEGIKAKASSVWAEILRYKSESSITTESVFDSLRELAEKAKSLYAHEHKIKFNVKKPKHPSNIDKYSGEGLLISRFFDIITKFTRIQFREHHDHKQTRDNHSKKYPSYYYETIKLARELVKCRRFLKNVSEGIEHYKKENFTSRPVVRPGGTTHTFRSDATNAFSTESFTMARPTL